MGNYNFSNLKLLLKKTALPIIKIGISLTNIFIKLCISLISIFEVPVFLMKHRSIFSNDIIYVFWQWSFGHTISGLDYASRLYYPHRITLIYIPHPRSNPYLPLCFGHNMEPFIYKSIFLSQSHIAGSVRYGILKFILLLLSGLTKKFHVIEYSNVYKTVSLAENKLMMGNEITGKLEKTVDWTGYIRLLRSGIGKNPRIPDSLSEKCRNSIGGKYPEFFSKPFVTMLLREKGRGESLDSDFRCSGPQENYIPAVKFMIDRGYNVVGTGETVHNNFKGIDGYFSFEDIDADKKLMNLFFLMYCSLFIGQQSGPHILPNSCGIPCLICDAMPYRLGTFNSEDIIIFKHLRDRNSGKLLSLVDVFKNHPDLAYGYNFSKKNVAIKPNTPEEILEAVKESLSVIEGKLNLADEDKLLCEKFRKLPSDGMSLLYHGNRTSLHILRKMKSELLRL